MTQVEIERLTVIVATETAKAIKELDDYQKKIQETADKAEREAKRAAKWITDNTFFKNDKERNKYFETWSNFADRFGITAAKIGSHLDYHVNRRLQSMGRSLADMLGNFGNNPMSLLTGGVAGHAVMGYFQSQIASAGALYGDQQRIGAGLDSERDSIFARRFQESQQRIGALRGPERMAELQKKREDAARRAAAADADVRRTTEALERVEEGKDRIFQKRNPDGTRGTDTFTYADDRRKAEDLQRDALKRRDEARKERSQYDKQIADLGGGTEHMRTRMMEENNLLEDQTKLLGKAAYETHLLKLENEMFEKQVISALRVRYQQNDLEENLIRLRRERAQIGMTADQRAAFNFDPTGTNPEGAAILQQEALRLSAQRTAEEFASPFEKYQKRIADLSRQNSTGLLTQENYNRALEDARKKYNAAAMAAYGFANAIGHVQGMSAESSAGVASFRNYLAAFDTTRFQFSGAVGAVPNQIFTDPTGGAAGKEASAVGLLTQIRDSLRILAKEPKITLQPAGG